LDGLEYLTITLRLSRESQHLIFELRPGDFDSGRNFLNIGLCGDLLSRNIQGREIGPIVDNLIAHFGQQFGELGRKEVVCLVDVLAKQLFQLFRGGSHPLRVK
jgi:hypothetical protein